MGDHSETRAKSPNTSIGELILLARAYPDEVSANPALALVALEDPVAYERILNKIDLGRREAKLPERLLKVPTEQGLLYLAARSIYGNCNTGVFYGLAHGLSRLDTELIYNAAAFVRQWLRGDRRFDKVPGAAQAVLRLREEADPLAPHAGAVVGLIAGAKELAEAILLFDGQLPEPPLRRDHYGADRSVDRSQRIWYLTTLCLTHAAQAAAPLPGGEDLELSVQLGEVEAVIRGGLENQLHGGGAPIPRLWHPQPASPQEIEDRIRMAMAWNIDK